MTALPARFQSLILPHHIFEPPDLMQVDRDLTHLKLLVPEAAHAHSSREYALAYAERYQGDILRLEHEWDFLVTALLQAWQQEAYEVVVRLTIALAYPAGRRALTEARGVLKLGMAASYHIQDMQRLASFMNRLGGILSAHGQYQRGWEMWNAGLQLAESVGSSPGLWDPLYSFVQIADLLGDYTTAGRFVEAIQVTTKCDDLNSLAVALFVRGLYARFAYDLDQAYEDFSHCLRVFLSQEPGASLSPTQQLFTLVVSTELERVQGNYAHAQRCAETAIALAQVFSERYTVATLLIDQGLFAYRQGHYADMYATSLRLNELARQMDVPHIAERSRFLAQHLDKQAGVNRQGLPELQDSFVSAGPPEPLSERETEVLRFVAAGLSNREIAERLVVAPGTVKKHLEHIYAKLDVHSRTAAIARARKINLLS